LTPCTYTYIKILAYNEVQRGEEEEVSTIEILFGLYFAFIGTYVSVILTRALSRNGKILDNMDERFKRMDNRI
jgi:hypothetical protein